MNFYEAWQAMLAGKKVKSMHPHSMVCSLEVESIEPLANIRFFAEFNDKGIPRKEEYKISSAWTVNKLMNVEWIIVE